MLMFLTILKLSSILSIFGLLPLQPLGPMEEFFSLLKHSTGIEKSNADVSDTFKIFINSFKIWATSFVTIRSYGISHQPINPSNHQPINPSTHQPINPSTHQHPNP